jgi:hypothetical protein
MSQQLEFRHFSTHESTVAHSAPWHSLGFLKALKPLKTEVAMPMRMTMRSSRACCANQAF